MPGRVRSCNLRFSKQAVSPLHQGPHPHQNIQQSKYFIISDYNIIYIYVKIIRKYPHLHLYLLNCRDYSTSKMSSGLLKTKCDWIWTDLNRFFWYWALLFWNKKYYFLCIVFYKTDWIIFIPSRFRYSDTNVVGIQRYRHLLSYSNNNIWKYVWYNILCE